MATPVNLEKVHGDLRRLVSSVRTYEDTQGNPQERETAGRMAAKLRKKYGLEKTQLSTIMAMRDLAGRGVDPFKNPPKPQRSTSKEVAMTMPRLTLYDLFMIGVVIWSVFTTFKVLFNAVLESL